MNSRAFGEPHPTEVAKPYAKKVISPFMLQRTVAWDPIRGDGNPTSSETVNAVLKKEGVQAAARRPIEYDEFINLLELVCSRKDKGPLKYLMRAVLTLQW
ncbi:hypothetical protein PHMEG_00031834 [Phytophthora megakarya]|uniref:Uncharacterized protein n=1 Tax=Phytophthora megakarya TaxID=4795 RepID=A0A225UXQ7_9STRA|nr:hypothetical protein PHMEG_00031834 [Phytophthora megakarya]